MAWHNTLLEQRVSRSQALGRRTQALYLKRVQAFIEFAGTHPIGWTTANVENWRDDLLDRGLKPQTVNLYLSAVRFASKRLAERQEGLDFARAAERARKAEAFGEPPKKKALTLTQCKKLLSKCIGRNPIDLRDRAMILLGIHAGLRREALCSLEFDHVGNRTVGVYEKGYRYHDVKLSKEPWIGLQNWMTWLQKHGVQTGRVFRSIRSCIVNDWYIGQSISSEGFSKMLRNRGADAGINGLHPHMLRHTYCSLALASGMAPWRVKKVLGHRSDWMIDIYTHDLSEQGSSEAFPNLTE